MLLEVTEVSQPADIYIYIYIYRVIHKSLRDFRPLRYSSRDGHAEGEHVNRGRDTPSFCPTLQVLDMLTSEGSWQTFLAHARQSRPWPWPASSFRSAQAATLPEFHVPHTNCFVRRWFCAVGGPKPPLHRHNWLSFGKFQDTERFLIHCARHFSSRLPPSGGTCKYAKAPSTKNFERFSTYWYAPFCHVCLGCCALEFGISGGTYE